MASNDPIFFVSAPEWSCDYNSTTTSFEAVLFFTASNVYFSGDADYHCRLKVTTNGKTYYSPDTAPEKYSSGNGRFYLKAAISGLSPSTAYECTMIIQWRLTDSNTWYNHDSTYGAVGYTKGSPPPFKWGQKNYSNIHLKKWGSDYEETGFPTTESHLDGSPIKAYFNASEGQIKKAYNALTNNGLISDFNTCVWNDILDRITWVQREWGMADANTIWKVSPQAYISYDSPQWQDKPVPGNMLTKYPGKAITAYKFNRAVQAIVTASSWPWEKELGRKEIKPSDLCKGSYFIALVDALNHWISLVPLPMVISESFSHSMSGKAAQLPSVPVDSTGQFRTTFEFVPDSVQSIQVAHKAEIKLKNEPIDLIVENGSLAFGSQFNFFDFNTEMCKAASVTAYVIGEFNGSIKQPTQVIDIGFASTLTIQSSGQIAAPKHTVDLTAPPGCVIGEHGYTLHTQSAFQIGTAPSFYLEHDGIFGVVNEFTITPKDNDQSVLEGTIGFADTIDGMITEPGVVMEYSKQLSMSDSFMASTSTGNVMSQDAQIRLVSTTDITSSTIIPLELDGNVSMSATVDDMREGRIFEIVDGSASVAIKPTSEVAVINTVGLSSTDTRVGVSAIAENNANDPIELDGNVTATVGLDESVLNSQRDVLISASANNTIKSVSTVNSAKRKIVDGSASVAIKPTSEVATAKPKQTESHEVLVTEESVGTLIRKPRVHMSSAVVDIMNTTETTMGAINMTHTRSVSVDERVVVGGIAEMTASKGQKEIGIEHVETINAEAVLAYKVPTALNSSEAVRIDAIGTADKSSSYLIESESETVLVRSEASLSLGTVSLILASELDDTLVSELDDTFAYDAERIIRITANNDSNTK